MIRLLSILRLCCGSAVVSVRIRIRIGMLNRIRIQESKINADPDPQHCLRKSLDPVKYGTVHLCLSSEKEESDYRSWLAGQSSEIRFEIIVTVRLEY
jgi:hypothetical protein